MATLLLVHAHPDDEVFSTGGILAKYAASGVHVVVVYATRGEVGEMHHPELNPEEAMHWYRRARLTISDPATRSIAPAIADHPDALAVWEYLDRSIDPSIIGRTFELP